jgi:hypothetical protein
MPFFCVECVKVPALRRLITTSGTLGGNCIVCGADKRRQIDCANPDFKSKFRALIRFYYSETDYNTHLGGDALDLVLSRANEITNFQTGWNEDAYLDGIMEIIEPAYLEFEKGISLYSGYSNGDQNTHLISLRRGFDFKLKSLKIELTRKNHFLLEEKTKALIEPLSRRVDVSLNDGSVLFRARLGFVASAVPIAGWFEDRHYRPYEGASISAPPPPIATAGRMNRGGVSFLYLATTADTAVSELRPHPGHYCSIGRFCATRKLRVADLSSLEVTEFSSSDRELDHYLLLKTIDDVFSVPVIPENRAEYNFAQSLADAFRQLAYDGVCYRSSVGDGKNYVFFNPQDWQYKEGSGAVVRIEGLTYATANVVKMGSDCDYWTTADGEFT